MDSGDVQHKRKRPTDGLPAKRASEPNIHPIEQHFSVDGANNTTNRSASLQRINEVVKALGVTLRPGAQVTIDEHRSHINLT
jgi:hypothetical protein